MKFLQILTTFLALNILFLYAFIFTLGRSGFATQEFLSQSITEISRGLLFGGITGLLIAFAELLYFYIKRIWDLHLVVPRFLIVHLVSIVIVMIILSQTAFGSLYSQAFGIGYAIGGLIAVIAYVGEVVKEHNQQIDEAILLEEDQTQN